MKSRYYSPVEIASILLNQKTIPFLQGKNGIGKTSILKDDVPIELNAFIKKPVQSLVVDFTQLTDIADFSGLMHQKEELLNDESYMVTDYSLPYWIFECIKNDKKGFATLVIIDEFNRLDQLFEPLKGIIYSRKFHGFTFPDSVYFALTGNLGDADGNEVMEFDKSVEERILCLSFDVTLEEWTEYFVKHYNFEPVILKYLRKYSEDFITISPRTWTNFSDSIRIWKKHESINVTHMLQIIAKSQLGEEVGMRFLEYYSKMERISFHDIVEDISFIEDLEQEELELVFSDLIKQTLDIIVPQDYDKLQVEKQFGVDCVYGRVPYSDDEKRIIIAAKSVISKLSSDRKNIILTQFTNAISNTKLKCQYVDYHQLRDVLESLDDETLSTYFSVHKNDSFYRDLIRQEDV